MAADMTVIRYGTDSSGRGIYMTQFMSDVWTAIKNHPSVSPFAWKLTIVQGAFMTRNGGGAAASAGYHDQAGCLDVRTWNLTTQEIDAFVRVSRMLGFAFWRRDYSAAHGGMDPHAHGTLGSDRPLSSGASASWQSYLRGGNGLAGSASDYEWRPSPLVTTPPRELMQEDYMATSDAEKKLDQILTTVQDVKSNLGDYRSAELKRDRAAAQKARESKKQLVSAIAGVADALTELDGKIGDAATKEQVRRVKKQLLTALADDPDVDGPDAPAAS